MALSSTSKSKLEKTLEKQKIDEEHVDEVQRIENKAKVAPFMRYCYNQQNELDSLRNARDKKTSEALNAAKCNRLEVFGHEMGNIKKQEFCDVKLRQQLRANCPELRDLERKLNAAYTNKIVMAQIKEKEAQKIATKLHEKEQTEKLRKAHVTEKEYFKHLKEIELKRQEQYKRALQDQMIYQENARRTKYEEFLEEKKLIDELVERIQEEDERDLQMKYCDMLKTKDDIRKFKESQDTWRARTKERLEQEDRAIQIFIKKKIDESKQKADTHAEQLARQEQFLDEVARKMYMEKRKLMERTELLNDLREEEERQKVEQRHREKIENEIRRKLDTKRSLNAQMKERLEHMQNEAARDAKYLEEMMAQMMESDKFEQMSAEKKRLKVIQSRRDIEDTIKANRLKKAMDMQSKLKQLELAQEEAEKRRLVIEDERVRMIKEHAVNLLGYLPPGIMSESEMDKLGTDLKEKLLCTDKRVP